MIETGRHRQTWLPPEQRLCSHCDLNQMETELHFLTECSKYTDIRTVFYNKIQQTHPTFKTLPDQEKLAYLLGEHKTCCVFAAQYVSLCHHRREDTPPALSWCSQHMSIILNHITLLYYLHHVHFASVNLIPYLFFIFFLVYILAYISNSFCTTCLILYIIIITIIIIFLSVNTYMHYL